MVYFKCNVILSDTIQVTPYSLGLACLLDAAAYSISAVVVGIDSDKALVGFS